LSLFAAGAATLAVFLSLTLAYGASVVKCERSFRWPVKTLSDPAAARINFRPRKATVDELCGKKVMIVLPEQRRQGPEFNVYEVTCGIEAYDISEDGDITAILYEPGHITRMMMGEMPDPDCPDVRKSPYRKLFRRVREEFRRECLRGRKPVADGLRHPVKGLYKVTGVGFVDVPHPMTGNAPNYFELHPVLSIRRIK
jgi:hypothetical protein